MVSKLGYRKDSPYKNRKSLTIDSNHITMKDVEFPLLLVPNNDNPVIAKPGEEYMFNNSQYVKEYRLKNMKYGGQTEELLMSYMAKMKPEEQAEFMARFEELGPQEKKMLLNSLRSQMHEVRNKYEDDDYMEMEDEDMEVYMYGGKKNKYEMKQGGIYIDPAKRGTFKAQATRMDMGVQEAASKILSNKEDYSPAMVKKANFARNAASWKKEDGGMIEYKMGGELPEYQEGNLVRVFNPDGSPAYVTKEEAMRRLNQITAPARTVFPLIPGGSAASSAMRGVVAMGRTSGKAAAGAGATQMTDEIFDMYNAMRPGMENAKNVGIAKNLEFLGVGAAAIGIPTAFEIEREAARRSANVPKVAMSSSMTKFLTDQGISNLRKQSTSSQQSTPFMLSRSSSPAPSPARPTASTPRIPAQSIAGDTYTINPEAKQTPRVTYTAQGPTATVKASRLPNPAMQEDEYVIQRGDTLSQIARRFGIPMEELARLNNIQNVNMIRAGSTLRLRPEQIMQSPTPNPVPQRPPVEPLNRLDSREQFVRRQPSPLPPVSRMPSDYPRSQEEDLRRAMLNVSMAMAQKPKKRRFFNRRTR